MDEMSEKSNWAEDIMGGKIGKVALIGAGAMAKYHLAGFRAGGAEVAAIVDRNPETGAAFAAKYGFAGNCYTSLAEMKEAQPDIKAVSVLTPNKFHLPLVTEALELGLHVFCEKPPALNAAEVRAMAALAAKKNLKLMFNLNNRARLDSQFVKDQIRKGRVGRINSAQATWQRRTGIPGFGGWFTTKALAGGGPLIDLLHMIDLALWFMDYPEPEYVLAQTFNDFIGDPAFQGNWGHAAKEGTTDVESACHGFVRFKTGQVLTIHNSWAELVKEEDISVTLQATETGVRIRTINELNSCELYSQEEGVSTDKSFRFRHDEDMGRTRAPENFIRVLNNEDEPLTTPEEALKLMKIIDAVYLSATSGKPVRIEEEDYTIL